MKFESVTTAFLAFGVDTGVDFNVNFPFVQSLVLPSDAVQFSDIVLVASSLQLDEIKTVSEIRTVPETKLRQVTVCSVLQRNIKSR